MRAKKWISVMLVGAIVFSGFSQVYADENVYNKEATGYFGDNIDAKFISEASQFIRDSWDENYFSHITMKIGEGTMSVDGKEIEVAPATMQGDEVELPIVDIANAIGMDVKTDEDTGDVTIVEDGKTVTFSDADKDPMPEDPLQLRERMRSIPETKKVGADVKAEAGAYDNAHKDSRKFAVHIDTPDNKTTELHQTFSAEKAENELGFDVQVSNDTILITKPYQMKQIILQTANYESIKNTYDAEKYVTNHKGLYVLQYATEAKTKTAFEALRQNSQLEFVTLNGVVHAESLGWGTDRISAEPMKTYLATNDKTKNEIIVAVVDTGVDISHPFLEDRIMNDKAYDFVADDSSPEDVYGHGTHVTGTIVDCTTENVKVMPVKVMGDDGFGDDLTIYMGIKYAADNGAKVINMSFIGENTDPNNLIVQGVKYAISKGVTCVAAAGNDTMDATYFSPANVEDAITVAATDDQDLIADFSNFGDAIDVAAPGVEIYSCEPGGGYQYHSGTSMATPHVVAAAAMLLSDNPDLTPAQVEEAVRNTAVDCQAPGWDRQYGAGVLDFRIFLGEDVPATDLTLLTENIDAEASIAFDNRFVINAAVEPMNATNKSISFTSDNDDVAVYEDGKITIKNVGDAVITATISNGISKTCNVHVSESQNWIDSAAQSFAGGSGTVQDPYLIQTPEQLAKIAKDIASDAGAYDEYYFKQIADIDLQGKRWLPISYRINTEIASIYCNYDGNGYQIKNMTIRNLPSNYIDSFLGLFGSVTGIIKNISLINADVEGQNNVGGIAGKIFGSVDHCYVNGTIKGAAAVGGIVGDTDGYFGYGGSDISNCYSDADISASVGYAGGIVGQTGGTIHNSYFSGTVSATDAQSGGITGILCNPWTDSDNPHVAWHPKIINCFSTTDFVESKLNGEIINGYYAEGYNGVIEDKNPEQTDLHAKLLSFFKDKDTYLNNGNWNESNLWDFDTTWEIKDDSFPSFASPPYQSEQSDFVYRDLGRFIEILGYAGQEEEVVIPEKINNKPVTQVRFFDRRNFSDAQSPMNSIHIPASVTFIGEGASSSCENLSAITVAEDNPVYSSQDGVLFDKLKTTLIAYPMNKKAMCYRIPESVMTIGTSAFYRQETLAGIIFPEHVTTIEDDAFLFNPSLKTASFLGDAPVDVGASMFEGTPDDFCIRYFEGKNGWSSPEWNGLKTTPVNIMADPPGNFEFVEHGDKITLFTASDGATVYYTTDGSEPTTSSNVYVEPISLESMVIKAIVVIAGEQVGGTETFQYKFNKIIAFEDENFEKIVRQTIQKPDGAIFWSDVQGVFEMNAQNAGIHSISGIENFENLQWLMLDDNEVSDITVLKGLKNINYLSLRNNGIGNIEPLATLTQLEHLALGQNEIADISPLRTLTQITSLQLDYNHIADLNALQELKNLDRLSLDGNGITDITALGGLSKLVGLSLADNQIDDIRILTVLQGLKNITDLSLRNNRISNIEPLAALTQLEQLDLDQNEIVDISPLRTLTQITSLQLDYNHIADLNALQELKNLDWLSLECNDITDITALGGLSKLAVLNLADNQIDDVRALTLLQGLKNITRLDLWNNRISNIEPLAALTQLEYLGLGQNEIVDISPLRALTQITTLQLDDNHIADLSALEELENLEWLGLSGNDITDITALGGLSKLTWLGLGDNQIDDIRALENLRCLAGLDLSRNQITNIEPLKALTNLEYSLELNFNSIDFSDGSDAMKIITPLIDKGVSVGYGQQYDNKVSNVLISHSSGRLEGYVDVSMACDTSEATIYYTTNGDKPTKNATKYTGTFEALLPMTIKAIAIQSSYANSDVTTVTYSGATDPENGTAPYAVSVTGVGRIGLTDTLQVHAVLSNDSHQPTEKALVVVAYDESGKQLAISVSTEAMEASTTRMVDKTLVFSSFPTNAYTIKAFLWEDVSGMRPASKPCVYEVQ